MLLQRLKKGNYTSLPSNSDQESAYWMVRAEALQMLAQSISISTVGELEKR